MQLILSIGQVRTRSFTKSATRGSSFIQRELNDLGGAKELALYRLKIAKEDLAAAVRCYEAQDYRAANNRAYYAIFRAVSACLALEFKAYKQHGQVLGNFIKDFVHTGIFPKDIARKISRAQEVRHESDYSDFYIVSISETKEQIDTAAEVVQMVEEYLNTQTTPQSS